jgi:hypothetical protein
MSSTTAPLFSDAMILRPVDGRPGEFDGNLNEHWTIGPKVHGGVMVALCAKAAREAYREPAAEGGSETAAPVAVSANFLSAPDPGPVRVVTTMRKRGRRIGLMDVELVSGDRACVHAVVTLGDPEHDAVPLMSDNPVTPLMNPEPPADVGPIEPMQPSLLNNNLARGCDIRPRLIEGVSVNDSPVNLIWVRPRQGRVDELFALMCSDISMPVPFAVGRRGWAPTVQLTAYLRGLPADGWLRVVCTAAQIGQDWFDEDHTVVDSAGRIIVQSRQLALVPGR